MNAEVSAVDVLNAFWRGRGVPVDSAWIAGQLGVRVVETKLPVEVSVALIKAFNQDPQIVLSRSDSKSQKRFSCALALGRYIFLANNGEGAYSRIELRAHNSVENLDSESLFASAFARALLMPKEAFQDAMEKQKEIFSLVFIFGVGPEVVSGRLRDIQNISDVPLATRWFSKKSGQKVRMVAKKIMKIRPFQSTDSIFTRFRIKF